MRIAFLILAHNNPIHLHRLIDALSHENTHCFLHIDKKSDIEVADFQKDPRISLSTERFKVFWGDFSMIEAIIALTKQAVQHQDRFDRIVLVSGADYPVRPINEIVEFFNRNPDREYINLTPMPDEVAGKPIKRLIHYKIHEGGSTIHRLTSKILAKFSLLPRKRSYTDTLGTMKPYGGSTWWALTREASQYIVDFPTHNKVFYSYFKNTHYPDEMLFHTIIGNSPFADHTVRNLTYTDWSAKLASPVTLDESHLITLRSGVINQGHDAFGEGPMLFARKFNDESDTLIQDLDNSQNVN